MKIIEKTLLNNGLTRHLYEDGSYVDAEVNPPLPPKTEAEILAENKISARVWRNLALQQCDWICPVTDHPMYESYMIYRKTLRDWPSTTDFPDKKPVLGG